MRPSARTLPTGRLGYTVVELMMSLSVLAIGATGVIAMQKVTLSSNRYAKELAVATHVGEAWADALTTDAALWTVLPPPAVGSSIGATQWLNLASLDPKAADWFTPDYSVARGLGAGFGPLGRPVDMRTQGALAHFCVSLRLGFVRSDVASPPPVTAPGASNAGNGVIRAQIRVYWLREDATVAAAAGDLCSINPTAASFDQPGVAGAYHVIYLTTAVHETVDGRLP